MLYGTGICKWGYRYTLASLLVILSIVRLNGKDISKYLMEQTTVGWYNASKNIGHEVTNADGIKILNVIATKYRLDLSTRQLTYDEFIDFFSEILNLE